MERPVLGVVIVERQAQGHGEALAGNGICTKSGSTDDKQLICKSLLAGIVCSYFTTLFPSAHQDRFAKFRKVYSSNVSCSILKYLLAIGSLLLSKQNLD